MKKLMFSIVAFILCFYNFVIAQEPVPQSLKDSLLQYYSMEELRSMSSKDRWNIIRKLRGLKPIYYGPKQSGDNGLNIIREIPYEEANEINEKTIDSAILSLLKSI